MCGPVGSHLSLLSRATAWALILLLELRDAVKERLLLCAVLGRHLRLRGLETKIF